MARYVGIPPIAASQGLPLGILAALDAMKTNIELLTGQRGETGNASAAIKKESIRVTNVPEVKMQRSSAVGSYATVSGVKLAQAEDVAQAITDLNTLATDVQNLRAIVVALISQLRT